MEREHHAEMYLDLKTLITQLESKNYTITQMAERIGVQKYIIDDLMRKKPRATNNYIPVIQKLELLLNNPDIEFTTDKYVEMQEKLNNIEDTVVSIHQQLNIILQHLTR